MAAALERVSERLPAMVVESLREQWARVARARRGDRGDRASAQAVASRTMPPAGGSRRSPASEVLSATAAVAAMGDPAAFKSPAGSSPLGWAWCPGTAAPVGGSACSAFPSAAIPIMRTLLIHGARSVFTQ